MRNDDQPPAAGIRNLTRAWYRHDRQFSKNAATPKSPLRPTDECLADAQSTPPGDATKFLRVFQAAGSTFALGRLLGVALE
ncbi:MAG TPA: hypothetical protein VH374_21375 [Polyangia bacterium]|jgi:hypothetical protein|nr:hypothetical protein [Polyangia bacterium]